MEFWPRFNRLWRREIHVIAKEKIRERVGLVYLAMLLRCVRLTCKHYLVQKSWKIKMFWRANSIQTFNKE